MGFNGCMYIDQKKKRKEIKTRSENELLLEMGVVGYHTMALS